MISGLEPPANYNKPASGARSHAAGGKRCTRGARPPRYAGPATSRPAPRGGAFVPWDPAQYLKFSDHRLRPAVDLLNRIDVTHPARVYDLGAGAGNVTRLLKERWPKARVTGVDDSREMLEKAARAAPHTEWQQADLATW